MELGGPTATVSVALAARNEEAHLGAAIQSILDQDTDQLREVVIAVAPSDDRTLEIAERFASRDHRVLVIANPSGRTPDGFNLAAARCTADHVALMNAHCTVPSNYLSLGLATARTTGAANVGGRQRAVGQDDWTAEVAVAMNHPIGTGMARHHWDDKAGPIESVPLGFFTRAVFEELGGFDASLERNQDYELNWRIRNSGHTVWFNPEMEVLYHPRPDLRSLARQYLDYGRHKQRVMRMWPRSIRPHQAGPPLLVAGLAAASIGAIFRRPWLWLVPAAYAAAVTALVTRLQRDDGRRAGLRAALATMTMHLAWGAGVLLGPRRRRR